MLQFQPAAVVVWRLGDENFICECECGIAKKFGKRNGRGVDFGARETLGEGFRGDRIVEGKMGDTGFEPVTSCVSCMRSNQLS